MRSRRLLLAIVPLRGFRNDDSAAHYVTDAELAAARPVWSHGRGNIIGKSKCAA